MKCHLPAKAIVPLAACCFLVGACSTPDRTKVEASLTPESDRPEVSLEQIVGETYDSIFTLMAPLYLFYTENERWPASGQELQAMTRQMGLSFDLSRYSELRMRELEDGSLLVRFQLAPPGQGGAEFVLAKPDEDGPPVERPFQRKMLM